MNECYEVAESLYTRFVKSDVFCRGNVTFDQARQWVKAQMPDESVVVVDNVTESLMSAIR